MLLMTKAMKTKSSETIGKGVAVRTISGGRRRRRHRDGKSLKIKSLSFKLIKITLIAVRVADLSVNSQ